ncbi:HEAT repeat domain-containing protein [Cellvibrio sp. pealriver]|uniref:HEAT repeat domain-containing protein n=1 Tax=Cellvibrio sp. pealriver TaxID=1622269 RepID=UPI00066FCD9A|nr:HEAT repeat domain-containing protein [Cellvibrio sp. pealriver]
MELPNAIKISRSPLNTIVEQHVEEAAFCWLRREDSLWSPNINLNQFYRIEQRLDANLEGLRLAVDTAWPYALQRMNRWQTADELFAASYIAIQTGRDEQLHAIAKVVKSNSSSSAGLSSALQWTLLLGDKEKAITAIQFFWQLSDSLKNALICTALQIPEMNTDFLLTMAIKSSNLSLRIKALEAIGQYQLSDYIPALMNALNDNEPLCQLAASASLAILGRPEHQQKTVNLIPRLGKNERLKYLLTWCITSSEQSFEHSLPTFNTSTSLRDYIWANAFRGTSSAVERLIILLDHKIAAPLAAYAIHHITGINLDSFDDIREIQSDADTRDDQEGNYPPHIKQLLREVEGLSTVSASAVKQWLSDQSPHNSEKRRLLNGISVDNVLPALSSSCAMPQHWQRALLSTLSKESQEWASFPKPFFIY